MIGYLASSFVADLLTVWVTVPVLVMLCAFGVLVIIGIPLHEIPGRSPRPLPAAADRDRVRRRPRAGDTPLVLDAAPVADEPSPSVYDVGFDAMATEVVERPPVTAGRPTHLAEPDPEPAASRVPLEALAHDAGPDRRRAAPTVR